MTTSYHNDPALKAETVARARAHVEADRLIAGHYRDGDLGCSIGCHAMDLGLIEDDHVGLAAVLSWPLWLVRLEDVIFENLPSRDRPDWHVSIAEAVPVGADLRPTYHKIMARILREVGLPQIEPDKWGVRAAVDAVVALHDKRTAASDPRWKKVEAAARTAAYLAKKSARSAKGAAVWSSVAEAAAEAAVESAMSAWLAASWATAMKPAAWQQVRYIVLDELRESE